MRLYRVLVVADAAVQAPSHAALTRLRERLTARGLQVDLLDEAGGGSGQARDRLSGYSGLVILDDAPIADPLAVTAITMGRRLLDLRRGQLSDDQPSDDQPSDDQPSDDQPSDDQPSDQELDDWARTVLPAHER